MPFAVVDAAGRVNPNADTLVRFQVEGPGTLAAVGNGDPASLESYKQPQRKAWQGVGLVIVKSAVGKRGRFRLTATGDGLACATVEIESR